jgi:hypothetical protein
VERHIIITQLMELQNQTTKILLASRDGLRSDEYKQLQLKIKELQTQLQNEQNSYIR